MAGPYNENILTVGCPMIVSASLYLISNKNKYNDQSLPLTANGDHFLRDVGVVGALETWPRTAVKVDFDGVACPVSTPPLSTVLHSRVGINGQQIVAMDLGQAQRSKDWPQEFGVVATSQENRGERVQIDSGHRSCLSSW
jgi:hypothetical protein